MQYPVRIGVTRVPQLSLIYGGCLGTVHQLDELGTRWHQYDGQHPGSQNQPTPGLWIIDSQHHNMVAKKETRDSCVELYCCMASE